MFFFFFFEELYHIEDIRQAFKDICYEKLNMDGYIDMNPYIKKTYDKKEILLDLQAHKSRYTPLYQQAYPKGDEAVNTWDKCISSNNNKAIQLTVLEAKAIVNWVYNSLKNTAERAEFTKAIFAQLGKFYELDGEISYAQGIVFDKKRVEINFCSTLHDVTQVLPSEEDSQEKMFYRGHTNPNYFLEPSVMRTPSFLQSEDKMYQEILIDCPNDFEKASTHLDKLVKMQHYGLPTRLLDITRNPLVALYFACNDRKSTYGELILISAPQDSVMYSQNDLVALLSSLAALPIEDKNSLLTDIAGLIWDRSRVVNAYNHLKQELCMEKPNLVDHMAKTDVLKSVIVQASKNNRRIIRQNGAFILCGLSRSRINLSQYRYEKRGKKIIILLSNKKKILNELDLFSINRAELFPEIDCVAEYLRDKYK